MKRRELWHGCGLKATQYIMGSLPDYALDITALKMAKKCSLTLCERRFFSQDCRVCDCSLHRANVSS